MDKNILIKKSQEIINSFNPRQLMAKGFLPLDNLFFPSIYYPPLTMYPQSKADKILANYKFDALSPLTLYLHIPFCPSKCAYCHWVTAVNKSAEEIDYYLGYLEKELDLWKIKLEADTLFPTSILIGGGTPSMLSPLQMEKLLKFLTSKINLSKCRQFTCEVEPKTISAKAGKDKLKIMKEYGVNRISLGVQSLDDDILRKMHRIHTVEDVKKGIRQIKDLGFRSLSIDLIYGYPECTLEGWIDTLKTAGSLDIDAYQLYRLRIIPHGDKVGLIKSKFNKSPSIFPDLDQIYLMKELGILISEINGFKENFRRIFSKGPEHISFYLEDYCCKLYNVIGLGISSWSNLGDRLIMNTGRGLREYYSYIKDGHLPIDRGKIRSFDDMKRWALILPLKNCGASKDRYKAITGESVNSVFGPRMEKLKKFGLLSEDKKEVFLTSKGAFFADETVMQFYNPKYLPYSKLLFRKGDLNPYNV